MMFSQKKQQQKKTNLFQIKKRGDLYMKLNQDFDKLIDKYEEWNSRCK